MIAVERPLQGKVAVITGTSRGIGAEIAKSLAEAGADIIGTHVNLQYEGRASRVEQEVLSHGVNMKSTLADITETLGRQSLRESALSDSDGIDYLILNAAGGLEQGKGEGWAEKINIEAQLALVDEFLPHLRPSGKIIYLTSLWAHYYGEVKMIPGYESVARTKHAAEQALRERMPQFSAQDVRFGVLCGHIITGTAAHSLFRLADREGLQRLEATAEGGSFPTAVDMGKAAREMIMMDFEQGYTYFVGGQEVERLTEVDTTPFSWNREEIRQKLPMYGDSKLLVDEFHSPADKKTGIGQYRVRESDTEGHFLGEYGQLFRGVDQIEAAALTLGLIFLAQEPNTQAVPFFRGIDGPVRFVRMIFPGELITLDASLTERTTTGLRGNCNITVGGLTTTTIEGIDIGLAPNLRVARRIISGQKAERSK